MNRIDRPSSTAQLNATAPWHIGGANRFFVDFRKKIPPSAMIFLFFFSIYAFTMSGGTQYGDETEKYRVAQSIVDRHEFSFRPTAQRRTIGASGQNFSIYELGQTLLEVPFYALGRAAYAFFPVPDLNWVTLLFVGFLNPILTALTCLLLFKTSLALGFRLKTCIALTLLFGLGTIAWPYSRGFTREPLLGFLILLSFYTAYLFQKTNDFRWLIASGVAVGYLVFTKLLHAMVIPVLLIYIIAPILQRRSRVGQDAPGINLQIIRSVGLFVIPTFIFLILQSIYALLRFGTVYSGIGGTSGNPLDWGLNLAATSHPLTAMLGLFLSPEKSVFLYSPPAILFLLAWFRWFRAKPKEALVLLALIVFTFISAVIRPDWDTGGWWGPRYFVQITPLLIIPLGVLESSSNSVRRFWKILMIVLFALGLSVQFVGVFTNERDYLDITGRGPWLAGQIDFLRHGALDSLVLYLSPIGSPIQINPYGTLLISVVALFGIWLVQRTRRTEGESVASTRLGAAVLALVLLIEFAAFSVWIVAPYPRVLAAKANTKFVAGNLFLVDARKCEAAAMYRLALERETTYQREAVTRLDELAPHARGVPISADDLMAQVEMPDNATVNKDETSTLLGEGSLKMGIPMERDAIVMATSNPIGVQPNTTYELSGWMKTEAIYGSGYAAFTIYEDDGNWANGRTTDIVLLDETHGWQPFWKSIATRATTRRIFVKASLWKTYGTLWVDGIQLAQITKENPPSPQLPIVCN